MNETWTRQQLEAILQIAVLGAYADGHLADEERQVLKECVATYASSEEECRRMFELVQRLPESHPRAGTEERSLTIRQAMAILDTSEIRELAFRLAVDVTAAHEGIKLHESQLLVQLVFDLEIDGTYARRVIDEAKSRFSSTAGEPLRPFGPAKTAQGFRALSQDSSPALRGRRRGLGRRKTGLTPITPFEG